uniref:Uncharacterized protein n=1 Tax=Schistocephalus solidus TaxID=70667 RepID=A0A0X3P021_SCHSO
MLTNSVALIVSAHANASPNIKLEVDVFSGKFGLSVASPWNRADNANRICFINRLVKVKAPAGILSSRMSLFGNNMQWTSLARGSYPCMLIVCITFGLLGLTSLIAGSVLVALNPIQFGKFDDEINVDEFDQTFDTSLPVPHHRTPSNTKRNAQFLDL